MKYHIKEKVKIPKFGSVAPSKVGAGDVIRAALNKSMKNQKRGKSGMVSYDKTKSSLSRALDKQK